MKSNVNKKDLYTVLAILITTIAIGLIYSATKTHTEVKKEVISYGYKRIEDPNLTTDKVNITQAGKDGEKTIVLQVNNWFHSIQTIKSSEITIQPVDEIAVVGTKSTAPATTDKALIESSKNVEKINECIKNKNIQNCSTGTGQASGYDEGYQWASDNNICDTNYDNGNSEDFNQGVQAWANDNCAN